MGYYKSPAEMFAARADKWGRKGSSHWAMAKGGDGDFHFGKARSCYGQAMANRSRALQMGSAVFGRHK